MNLDKTKAYGTIHGHAQAMYEQNGVLFDSDGDQLSKDKKKDAVNDSTDNDLVLENAKSFLQNILDGGAVSKIRVMREAENNNQSTDAVSTASTLMSIKKYQQGTTEMWKLLDTN